MRTWRPSEGSSISWARWSKTWSILVLLTMLFGTTACTVTRWSVDNPRHLDRQEDDEKIGESFRVELEHEVTRETPYLTFQLYQLDQYEVTERVRMQRRLQHYTPTWGFAALASLGAAISFYAGSRSGLTGLTTKQQSFAFHAMGGLLSLAVIAHLSPEGEAIETEEYLSLRGRSGQALVTDTLRVTEESSRSYPVQVRIEYADEILAEETFNTSTENRWVLDLPDLFRSHVIRGTEPGSIQLQVLQESDTLAQTIPLETFLQPVVQVQESTTQLYRAVEGEEALTTVAEGSEFPLVGELNRSRYSVQFGGSLVYVDSTASDIYWKEADSILEPSVIPAGEVPFGEIGVEFGLPALVDTARGDMALLVSNHRGNLLGSRRYTDRDLQLLDLYMRESFAIEPSSIHEIDLVDSKSIRLPEEAEGNRLFLWVSGFGRVVETGDSMRIDLVSMEESGEEWVYSIDQLLRDAASRANGSMVVFLDLTYLDPEELSASGNDNAYLNRLFASVAEVQPETAILFASRPGQPTGRYESLRFENRFHHIFPYYLAQAWKQEITRMDQLTEYVRRQVDYTSRRLHDRPQNVLFIGRSDLDLREE